MSNAVRTLSVLTLLAALVAAACDDNPFGFIEWTAARDTVRLYSLARPELGGLPSAFDFGRPAGAVAVETPSATGQWDVALSEQDGGFVLVPPGAFPGLAGSAGIAVLEGVAFEDVESAPDDTASFSRNTAVTVRTDVVYVVKTRQTRSVYGLPCTRFAKLQPLAVDAAAGTFRFSFLRNPNCNDRSLHPSDDGE